MSDYLSDASKKIFETIKNTDWNNITVPHANFTPPEVFDIEPTIPLADHIEKTEEYQQQSLKILQSIEANTANLYTLVDLINKSNDKQDEMLEILSEVLAIAKAKDKNEAGSLFKRIITKINSTVEAGESLGKLIEWAIIVYRMVNAILPQ